MYTPARSEGTFVGFHVSLSECMPASSICISAFGSWKRDLREVEGRVNHDYRDSEGLYNVNETPLDETQFSERLFSAVRAPFSQRAWAYGMGAR